MKKFVVLVCILTFVFASVGTATALTIGSHTWEDRGNVTFDSATGLEWLDVTESQGRSYNDVSGEFGVGGDYEGWRYAMADEVEKMYEEFLAEPSIWTDTYAAEAMELGQLLGVTSTLFWQQATLGIYDLASPTHVGVMRLIYDEPPAMRHISGWQMDPITGNIGDKGSYLVREATGTGVVPEPATMVLLGVGLLGLLALRRKVTHKR